jgi:predicted SprT family Zn-dependent metalloprotease
VKRGEELEEFLAVNFSESYNFITFKYSRHCLEYTRRGRKGGVAYGLVPQPPQQQ